MLLNDSIEALSAGTEPHGVNPDAVRVMAERGVDISRQRSKHVDELLDAGIDVVVTVCDSAAESCPTFPGRARVLRAPFDDPPKLARGAESEEERLAPYRRVRDEIRAFVERLPERLTVGSAER